MLQRKQTLFLLLALAATIVCLCLPVGRFEPEGMGTGAQMFNLWINNGGTISYSPWPLFAILLLSCPINILTIALFNNRKLQSKLCCVSVVMMVAWYVALFLIKSSACPDGNTFKYGFAVCLPFVAIVLYLMARKGINDDEKLVRAADRIR